MAISSKVYIEALFKNNSRDCADTCGFKERIMEIMCILYCIGKKFN